MDFLTEEFLQDFVDEAKAHIDQIEHAFLQSDDLRVNHDLINDVFRSIHSIKGTAGFFQLNNIVSLSHAMENVLGQLRAKTLVFTEEILDCLLLCNDVLKNMINDVGNSEREDITKCLLMLEALIKDQPAKQEKIELIEDIPNEKTLPNQVDESYYDSLTRLIKRGHKVYKITLNHNRQLPVYYKNVERLFESINEIGEVINASTDVSTTHNLNDIVNCIHMTDGDTTIQLEILCTSVLEWELFCEAIAVSQKNVVYLKSETFAEKKGEPQRESEPSRMKLEESIRVNVGLLENLMALSGEMVLARNQLLTAYNSSKKTSPTAMNQILKNVDRLTSKLQEEIMLTRMQPIGNVFNKFPRVIREISKTMNKEIELIIEGKEIELDKTVIEGLSDPIIHIVRNAADHGLELPHVREEQGKPRKGTISLRAYHKSGLIAVEISDDGRGVDVEAVKQKAVEKGLITKSEAMAMSEADAHKLIFLPGFSTAKQVSDISGRGVGMDVVKSNVEKLGGYVRVVSQVGKGTTITLFLQRTLAIMQSLLVRSADQRFVLPQTCISHVAAANADELDAIQSAKELRLRGKLIPVISLGKTLGLGESNTATKVVVIRVMNKLLGILVDAVLDTEEILVKPLPMHLKSCGQYSGVTILGDGRISLILDPEGLANLANIDLNTGTEEEQGEVVKTSSGKNLMVFQCSGPEHFAVELRAVSRVEKIKIADIEQIGNKQYAKIRGKAIRMIRPEDYLPVKLTGYFTDTLYAIIPKGTEKPMGILVKSIVDTLRQEGEADRETIVGKAISGSAMLKDKLVLLLNLQELIGCANEHDAGGIA